MAMELGIASSPVQVIAVTVPEGASAGSALVVHTLAGPVQAIVPAGLTVGMTFHLQMPSQPAVVQMPLQPAVVQLTSAPTAVPVAPAVDGPPQGTSIPRDRMEVAAAPAVSLPADLLTKGVEKIFALFSKVDQNSNGAIDQAELTAALTHSEPLRQRLCDAAGVSTDLSPEQIAIAVLACADSSGSGALEPAELERLIRGWREDAFATRADMTHANQQRRLAGAAERAEQRRVEGGGFAGLTDAEEALRIGAASQEYTAAEKFTFAESDPTVFAGGAHYVTDAAARAARDATDVDIRKQEVDEYLYKEAFKGLDADSALQVGESVKLGGEVVDSCFEAPKKAPPKKGLSQTPFFLEKKMQAEE